MLLSQKQYGDRVVIDGYTFVVVEQLSTTTKLVSSEILFNRAFSTVVSYQNLAKFSATETSSVGHYLNNTWLQSLPTRFRDLLRSYNWDTTSSPNGNSFTTDKTYANAKVGLLTTIEYGAIRNMKNFIIKKDESEHTLTLVSTSSTPFVFYWENGYIYNASASGVRGIRPAIVLPSNLELSNEGNVIFNSNPIVTTIPDQSTTIDATKTLNLGSYFSDPDGDVLLYTVTSSSTEVVTVSLSGNTLTIAPKAVGSSTITVTANDGKGGTVTKSFTATVVNSAPTIALTAPTNAQTFYENDLLTIAGTITDKNVGNVVSVKYSIDGGTARAILGSVSQGSAIAFVKNLTYKAGKLYDGATAITATLAEGSQHTVKIWAEDDQGGKSSEITRSFYVVPNRAATLTLDAFVTRTGLINTDVVNITGKVADLDNGNVIVKYKIANSAYTQVFSGTVGSTPTAFNFNIVLSQLTEGQNAITLQAVDAYGAITQQVLTLKKDKVETPLKTAVTYYQITPPNGTADGLQLFVERETGDLAVAVDVFMGVSGTAETFVPMTLASTANLTNGNVEETYSYQHSGDASKIVVRITMTRTGTATNKAIKKISGVLT